MPYWLIGEHRGERIHHRLGEGVCTVGRSGANHISLPSQTVSRNHAEIRFQNGTVQVTVFRAAAASAAFFLSCSNCGESARRRSTVLTTVSAAKSISASVVERPRPKRTEE